ncbi:MAG: ABC transporter ATP-binding protein [Herpetosiphonaceae bacterium]|nr:ABC transporter ATP-binding protein [Herpetosiphonaceae bacterium]
MDQPLITTRDLRRDFQLGGETIHAVDGVTVAIPAGQMVVIRGRSGSGKTTLLNLIAGLDEPTSGEIWIDGRQTSGLSERERVALRREKMGFVFQAFGLLPLLSARENVEVPLRIVKAERGEREARSAAALEVVGLSKRAKHRPYELSGGEQQRVALARALVKQPQIILADEPTGQLDSNTGREIIALMRRLVEQQRITLLVVTHDPVVVEAAELVHELRDGRLVS